VLGYLVRRTLWAAALFVVLTFCTYVLFFLLPTGEVQTLRGFAAESRTIRDAVPLHGSIFQEYGEFLWGVLHGQVGTSLRNGRGVNDVVVQAAPVTAALVFGGVVTWLLISIPIGIVSALRPRSITDRGLMVFLFIGVSAHPAWLSLVASYVFGFRLHWFPIAGYCDMFNGAGGTCDGPAAWAYHLILPWLVFAFLFAALYARIVRASVIETMDEDYVRTARAKGLPEWKVLRSHILRNALLPVVTMVGMDIGVALGGAVFVERVFGLPGLGGLLLTALQRRDLPVMMGVIVYTTLAILIFNLIVDLLYAVIDPRVRLDRPYEREAAQLRRARPRPVKVPATTS
jgi:peptide/nickel transport system permease protein